MSLVLINTSVWARHNQPRVRKAIADAIEANAVAMVVTVMLELLRSARNHAEPLELAEGYAALHVVPLTPDLGSTSPCCPGRPRSARLSPRSVPVDLLTAAAAESVGAELWHCDRDFELITQLTGQPIRRLGR